MLNIADYDYVSGGGGNYHVTLFGFSPPPRGIGNIFVTEKLSCD